MNPDRKRQTILLIAATGRPNTHCVSREVIYLVLQEWLCKSRTFLSTEIDATSVRMQKVRNILLFVQLVPSAKRDLSETCKYRKPRLLSVKTGLGNSAMTTITNHKTLQ